MKRWLSAVLTVVLVGGAGILGFSTLASAHHVDCTVNPSHAHCQPQGNVPGGNQGTPQACQGQAANKNPHCQPQAGGSATTTTAPSGGGGGGGGGGTGTTVPSGGGGGTAAAAGGGQVPTEVAGITATNPGAAGAPTPGQPAEPEAQQPRFTG